jgi:hypothetical protein
MSEHDRHLCEACLQEEYEEFAHDCVHKSIDQNNLWLEKYKIEDWPRWDYSLEDATLTFSQDGKSKVVCNIQAIGSVQGDSWEWSWGNQNLPDLCKTRMTEVREFGEEKQWSKLTSLFLDNDNEYLGWELASVTVHLLDGTAVYRCPDSETPGYFMYLVVLSSEFVN